LDQENPTCVSLAQENGFGSTLLLRLPWLVKSTTALCTCKKECNKWLE